MKTSIALIGFMGTGKSAVGRLLADELGKTFIDLDTEIELTAGKPVAAIFREDGEAHFRELEAQAAAGNAGRKNVVIACGGGIVLNNDNIFELKQECVIVCLLATLPDILKRTAGRNRPLLNVMDREEEIRQLLASRRPLYEKAADITIDTAGIDAPGVVKKILRALGKYESFDK
jgi:shikimate kinase